MPFCKPPEGIHRAGNAANLGTIIMGIRLENSQYNFTVMVGARQQRLRLVLRCSASAVACSHHTGDCNCRNKRRERTRVSPRATTDP